MHNKNASRGQCGDESKPLWGIKRPHNSGLKHKGRGLEYTTHNGHTASIGDNRSVVVVVAARLWLLGYRNTGGGGGDGGDVICWKERGREVHGGGGGRRELLGPSLCEAA